MPPSSRAEIVLRMKPYISAQLAKGVWLHRITRHMLGLFHGKAGGKRNNGRFTGLTRVWQKGRREEITFGR